MGFFRWLWGVSGTVWKYSATENRWAGNYGTLTIFVFLLFFLLFAVAWLFGYPPSAVTAWLDAHAAIWLWIAGALWRIFWGFVLLICAYGFIGFTIELFDRKAAPDGKNGTRLGCLVVIPVVAYVAWVGMTMSFD